MGDIFYQEKSYFLELDLTSIGFIKQIYVEDDIKKSIILFRKEYLKNINIDLIEDKKISSFIKLLNDL